MEGLSLREAIKTWLTLEGEPKNYFLAAIGCISTRPQAKMCPNQENRGKPQLPSGLDWWLGPAVCWLGLPPICGLDWWLAGLEVVEGGAQTPGLVIGLEVGDGLEGLSFFLVWIGGLEVWGCCPIYLLQEPGVQIPKPSIQGDLRIGNCCSAFLGALLDLCKLWFCSVVFEGWCKCLSFLLECVSKPPPKKKKKSADCPLDQACPKLNTEEPLEKTKRNSSSDTISRTSRSLRQEFWDYGDLVFCCCVCFPVFLVFGLGRADPLDLFVERKAFLKLI